MNNIVTLKSGLAVTQLEYHGAIGLYCKYIIFKIYSFMTEYTRY